MVGFFQLEFKTIVGETPPIDGKKLLKDYKPENYNGFEQVKKEYKPQIKNLTVEYDAKTTLLSQLKKENKYNSVNVKIFSFEPMSESQLGQNITFKL